MYLGTHVDSATMGVWVWPDAAPSPFYQKITHKTSKGRLDGTYHCPLNGSAGSASNDWCSRPGRGGGTANDERLTAAWLAKGKLGFAWNAGQDPPTAPFPWVNAILVNVADLPACSAGTCTVEYPWIASTAQAVQYATITSNNYGDVGGAFLYGGGASNLSCGAVLSDQYTESTEGYWSIAGLTASNRPPFDSSGDYMGIWPEGGSDKTWSGACMTHRTGGPTTSVHFIRFGRQLNDPGP
jgi:hypothetical protein